MAETPATPTLPAPVTCPAQLTVSKNRLAIAVAASPPYSFILIYLVIVSLEAIRGRELVRGWDFVISIVLATGYVTTRSFIWRRWSARMVTASKRAQAHAYDYVGEPEVKIHDCPAGRKVELGVTMHTSSDRGTVFVDLACVHWRADGDKRTVQFTSAAYRITRPGAVADLIIGDEATITTPELPGIVQVLLGGIGRFEPPTPSAT